MVYSSGGARAHPHTAFIVLRHIGGVLDERRTIETLTNSETVMRGQKARTVSCIQELVDDPTAI